MRLFTKYIISFLCAFTVIIAYYYLLGGSIEAGKSVKGGVIALIVLFIISKAQEKQENRSL